MTTHISPDLRAEFEERFPRPQKEATHFSDVKGKKDCRCLECNFDYDAILSFFAEREEKVREGERKRIRKEANALKLRDIELTPDGAFSDSFRRIQRRMFDLVLVKFLALLTPTSNQKEK